MFKNYITKKFLVQNISGNSSLLTLYHIEYSFYVAYFTYQTAFVREKKKLLKEQLDFAYEKAA